MENNNSYAIIGAYLSEKGMTQMEAIRMLEKALKDKAYREEYNKRPERVDYRKEYNRKKNEVVSKVRELTKRGVDIDDLVERMSALEVE